MKQIDFLKRMENFFALNDSYSFTAIDTMVYFFLLNSCHKLRKITFTLWNDDMKAACGVSLFVLTNSLKYLKDVGLIDFKEVEKGITKFIIEEQ